MQVRLDKRVAQRRRSGRRRFDQRRPGVTQDSRVDAIRKSDVPEVRVSTNPVVIDGLVGVELWATVSNDNEVGRIGDPQ